MLKIINLLYKIVKLYIWKNFNELFAIILFHCMTRVAYYCLLFEHILYTTCTWKNLN